MNNYQSYCYKCGTSVDRSFRFCKKCGASLCYENVSGNAIVSTVPAAVPYMVEEEYEEPMSSKIVSGIDAGIDVGARVYGAVLIVVGLVSAISTGTPGLLLISGYGVYLLLGGSLIIF